MGPRLPPRDAPRTPPRAPAGAGALVAVQGPGPLVVHGGLGRRLGRRRRGHCAVGGVRLHILVEVLRDGPLPSDHSR